MSAPFRLDSKALMNLSWALDNLGKIATENGVYVGSCGTIAYAELDGLTSAVELRVVHTVSEDGKVTYRLDDRVGE